MKFLLESKIWDLHIHTNKCPKGSGDFVNKFKDNTIGFVDNLIEVIDEHGKDLAMISFTDHNYIALDVYKEFYGRKHRVKLLPGVEIDYISNDKNHKPKHMIVYFDAGENEIKVLSENVNKLLLDARINKKYDKVQDLLRKIYNLGYNFMISPHVFKQGNRGLDSDWVEENYTRIDSNLYTDQFFCFWESAGLSNIVKATEYLEEFNQNDKISIVNFSDSDNFVKLEKFLKKPSQYFHSLPSFKGLALVSSDKTRIRENKTICDPSQFSNYIKKVEFNNQTIYFSNQLNTIIGGRGSGKSILLDSMALNLGESISNSERTEFLQDFNINMYDFNDKKLSNDFTIEYYSQSYVSDIFSAKDFSTKLRNKFSDAFDKIEDIDMIKIKTENLKSFRDLVEDMETVDTINLKGLTTSYIKVFDGLLLNIKRKDGYLIKKEEDLINYTKLNKNIESKYDEMIPKQIKNNHVIIKMKDVLKYIIYNEAKEYNKQLIKEKLSLKEFVDIYLKCKNSKNRINKMKSELSNQITDKLKFLSKDYVYRNSIVNAIIDTTKNFKRKYANYLVVDGSVKNRFIFSKELKVETPIEYFIRCIDEHFDKNKLRKYNVSFSTENFKELAKIFITKPEKYVKDSTSVKDMVDSILEFDLSYEDSSNIYYVDDSNQVKNIKKLSPGYQTNILMEYIVYKKTDKPLLIDQPEDNVDNQTIYGQLKKWFIDMKFKRQVIVVTHDANIVINSDAENVIIAEQYDESKFKYRYGALEYDDIVERATIILDGGKEAVQRRLNKYES